MNTPAELPPRVGMFSVNSWVIYLVAAVPVLIKLLCYPAYPGSDDAFIHLTMVRNLTHSLGWGINPGEPIYLSSSPLYTLVLAGLSLVGLAPLAAGEWFSALSGFFAVVLLHRLLVRIGLTPRACLAGAITAAFNIFLWRWNAIVMETTAGLFFLTLACWLYHGPASGWRFVLTGVVVGLAALTRFELALLLGCFGLCEMANHPPAKFLRSWVLLSLGFFLVLGPWLLFCHAYFHALLPTTFYKKTSAGILLWNPGVATSLAKLIVGGDAVPLLGVFSLGAFAVWRQRGLALGRTIFPRLDLFLFPLLLALFYYCKTPYLESAARYYLPGLHLLAVVLACLFDAWSRDVLEAWLRVATTGFLVVHMALALVINQWTVAPILCRFENGYWRVAQEASRFLRAQAATGKKRVLVEVDIGMLSYYASGPCYFIDGGALATPALRGKTVQEQITETKPDLVIETLGERLGGMAAEAPGLQLVWHRQFLSHSLTHPKTDFFTNIYENRQP